MRDSEAFYRTRPAQAESNRIRLVGRVLIVLLLLATLVVALLNVLLRPETPAASGWTTVSVSPDGTLWELASEHPIPGLSTAETVEVIRAENTVVNGVLHAGQVLRVPAAGSARTIAVASR